ncbi:hypothetical protein AF72_01475 [Xylella taiwanensis]|uniref:Uncharacterized protein n=1 Tax=Xylella taiwanensis TaxID=1444770 RepID=Z9JNC7_9GAMM|nr:hypothetical protein AF72_01475 [Xylella taiwanensis]
MVHGTLLLAHALYLHQSQQPYPREIAIVAIRQITLKGGANDSVVTLINKL